MATRAQKTKVGAFLAVSAVLIIGGLMVIAGYHRGDRDRYTIAFDKTVLGLYKGGMVQYMGVPVGTVEDIYVRDDGAACVELSIDPKKVTLHKGVEASLEYYSFATGTMCVALKGGDSSAPELPPGSVIPTGESLIESFSDQAGDLMTAFKSIAEKINKGLEGMPEGQLSEIVDQIKPFIDDSRKFIADARDTLKSVQQDVHGVIEDARPGVKKLGDVADTVTKLGNNANETLTDLRAKIEPLDLNVLQQRLLALSDQLEQTTAKINAMTTSVPYTVDNMQHELVDTMRKLNETLESFRELAETLKQNPYVRGSTAPPKD